MFSFRFPELEIITNQLQYGNTVLEVLFGQGFKHFHGILERLRSHSTRFFALMRNFVQKHRVIKIEAQKGWVDITYLKILCFLQGFRVTKK